MSNKPNRPFHPNAIINYMMEAGAWTTADMTPDPTMASYLQKHVTASPTSEESAPPRPAAQPTGAKLLRIFSR